MNNFRISLEVTKLNREVDEQRYVKDSSSKETWDVKGKDDFNHWKCKKQCGLPWWTADTVGCYSNCGLEFLVRKWELFSWSCLSVVDIEDSLMCSQEPSSWSLYYTRWIQSTTFNHFCLRSMWLQSSHLWLHIFQVASFMFSTQNCVFIFCHVASVS